MLLPFTYPWIIKRHLTGCISVLDLGCSDGALMAVVNNNKEYKVTGVDLFKPDLQKAEKYGVYGRLIRMDIRRLKIGSRYDCILSSQTIEHLTKKEGEQLILEMENLAKKRVIIATTVGFLPYDPIEGDNSGNMYQKHKSGWDVADFKKRGYHVYGQGTRFIYMENGLIRKLPKLFQPLLFLLSYLLSPINYFFPNETAYLQIAVKNLGV